MDLLRHSLVRIVNWSNYYYWWVVWYHLFDYILLVALVKPNCHWVALYLVFWWHYQIRCLVSFWQLYPDLNPVVHLVASFCIVRMKIGFNLSQFTMSAFHHMKWKTIISFILPLFLLFLFHIWLVGFWGCIPLYFCLFYELVEDDNMLNS